MWLYVCINTLSKNSDGQNKASLSDLLPLKILVEYKYNIHWKLQILDADLETGQKLRF